MPVAGDEKDYRNHKNSGEEQIIENYYPRGNYYFDYAVYRAGVFHIWMLS